MSLAIAGAVALAIAAAQKARATTRVFHRERANGVHPQLQSLLDKWEREGAWPVQVAGGADWPYPGGVRSSEATQAAAAAAGLSNASTLRDTPHGRAAALDVWPMGFDPHRGFDTQPGMRELMELFGEWAEANGVTWGGRFGDMPHVELRNWRELPFPPPVYGGVS